jgi:hypothetical protein
VCEEDKATVLHDYYLSNALLRTNALLRINLSSLLVLTPCSSSWLTQILAIHIPGVTDVRSNHHQTSQKVAVNQHSPESRRGTSANDFNRLQERNFEDKITELRTIPMNLDDIPVGKGVGGGPANLRDFDDDANADSRFSSNTSNRKKASPRVGRGDYDDDIASAPAHGQDSQVPYSRQEEKGSPRAQSGQARAKSQRQKSNDSYEDDFLSGNDGLR